MDGSKLYDVIIIGAGLGGLSAGSKLARSGKKVLMVEQHNIVGGCSTHFKRQRKMKFEVGLHEINGVEHLSKQALFKDLGILDRLEFVRVPEFYRFIKGDVDVVIPDDLDLAKKSLSKTFPKEQKAIAQYFKDIKDVRKQIYRYKMSKWKKLLLAPIFPFLINKLIKYRNTTTGEYLDELTDNEDLKFALIANIGYYSDNPYNLHFIYFASGNGSYMGEGGYFIKNGSQELSDAMADVIKENGGEIILKHMVNEIIVKDSKAVGIKYIRKKRPHAIEQVARGKCIIANTSFIAITNKLIPSLKDTAIAEQFNNMEPGCSLFTIYYSFTKPISDLTDNRYSTFVYHPDMKSIGDLIKFEKSGDFNKKNYVFVNYHAIDSGMNNQSSYTGVICGIDYLDNWEHLEKQEYKKKKQEVIEIMTERLDQQFPGIAKYIDYAELSTPRTIKRYTMNDYGTVYGYAQTKDQALINKGKMFNTGIDNLFVASAWVFSGGFSPAISGGYQVANIILRKWHAIESSSLSLSYQPVKGMKISLDEKSSTTS